MRVFLHKKTANLLLAQPICFLDRSEELTNLKGYSVSLTSHDGWVIYAPEMGDFWLYFNLETTDWWEDLGDL